MTQNRPDGRFRTIAQEEASAQARKSQRTRRAILDAAAALATIDGVNQLTLARVAADAGISKGGLLHHFSSKQELVAALLSDLLNRADEQLDELADSNDRLAGAFAQAYLDYVRTSGHSTETATGIFAAAALDDGDLTPARATFEAWQNRLVTADGIDETTALLARVIGDGLWLIDLFDLAPPSPAQRDALFRLVEARLDDQS